MTVGFVTELRLSKTMGMRWQVEAPLIYDSAVSDPPTRFTVPEGYKTAFTTIPPAVRWLVIPSEQKSKRATAPAVLLSWLVRESGERPSSSSRVFRESLLAAKVTFWQRCLLRMFV